MYETHRHTMPFNIIVFLIDIRLIWSDKYQLIYSLLKLCKQGGWRPRHCGWE